MQDMTGKLKQIMAVRHLGIPEMAADLHSDPGKLEDVLALRAEVPLGWIPAAVRLYGENEEELWEALEMTASEYADGEETAAAKMRAAAEEKKVPLGIVLQYAGAPESLFYKAEDGAFPTPEAWTDRAERLLGLAPGSLRRKSRSFVEREGSVYASLTGFGRRLAAWRTYHRDSPLSLSREMGTDEETVKKTETGQIPVTADFLERLALAYKDLDPETFREAAHIANNYERAIPSADSFPVALHDARVRAGESADRAAAALRLNPNDYIDMELGTALPDAETAGRISELYGVAPPAESRALSESVGEAVGDAKEALLELAEREEIPESHRVSAQTPFSARITRLCSENGISRLELAERLGISPEELEGIEDNLIPVREAVARGLKEVFGMAYLDIKTLLRKSRSPGIGGAVWTKSAFGHRLHSALSEIGVGIKPLAAVLGVPVRDIALLESGDSDVPEELLGFLSEKYLVSAATLRGALAEGGQVLLPGGKFDRDWLAGPLNAEGEELSRLLREAGTETLDFLNACDFDTAAFKAAFAEGALPPDWVVNRAALRLGDAGESLRDVHEQAAEEARKREAQERELRGAKPTVFGSVLQGARASLDISVEDMAKTLGVRPLFVLRTEAGRNDVPVRWIEVLSEAYGIDAPLLWTAYGKTPRQESPGRRRKVKTALHGLFERVKGETGHTPGRIAGDLGVSKSQLTRIEKGSAPMPSDWPEKIAALYGIPEEETVEAGDLSPWTGEKEAKSERLTPFGELLSEIRRGRNLTQTAMAERLGIRQSYLSAIEHGSCNIPRNLLPKIAGVFGADREALEDAYSFSPYTESRAGSDGLDPFGRLLSKARSDLGITQKEMAERVGCSPSTLSQISRGHHKPAPELVSKICSEFGIDPAKAAEAAGQTKEESPVQLSIFISPETEEALSPERSDFGDAFKKMRDEADVSQSRIGEALGLSAAEIWGIELGRDTLSKEQIETAGRVFGRDVSGLMRLSGYVPTVQPLDKLIAEADKPMAKFLLSFRKERRMPRRVLAEALGMNADIVEQIETGHQDFPVNMLPKLSEVTGEDLDALELMAKTT